LFALAPEENRKADETTDLGESQEGDRLVKGPAYLTKTPNATVASVAAPADQWPTYRGTSYRSGATLATIPTKLSAGWQADLGGKLTAPTIADGKAFVAVTDQHRVCALDMSDGSLVWSFTAGGPVDTPPTVFGSLVVFGGRDGFVYCLRAVDGELSWRLRAGHRDTRLVAHNQLESPWPVHGSVLVLDGNAYFAAGNSTHLDGGIHLMYVDVVSGAIWQDHILHSPLAPKQGVEKQGSLPDILVFDGVNCHMRNVKMPRSQPFATAADKPLHLMATGGLLDDTWFTRIFWSVNRRPLGQYLVFDETSAYGIRAYKQPGNVNAHFTPGAEGYVLFANDHKQPKLDKPLPKPKRRRGATSVDRWTVRIPLRSQAMVLAQDVVFVAGTPDVVDPDDPWAAYDGRKGGLLWAVSTKDGARLAEYQLDSPPVYDGLAAVAGHLLMSARDGQVRCYRAAE
jgi:outer membrane protein assembly factor BamB